MRIFAKKFLILFLAVFIVTAIFFFGKFGQPDYYFAKASLWDTIKAKVAINPLFVFVFAPAEVEIYKIFQVEAIVKNKGKEKIENAKGEIFLPPEIVIMKKDSVKDLGVIPGKKEKKISWAVKGGKKGNYVISVLVSGKLKGELVQADDSTIVTMKLSIQKKNFWQWIKEFF